MSVLSSWTSEWLQGETVRVWGLTLGHFLWEGLALALLLFCAMRFCRRAQTRYVLAVSTLAAMLIAPVVTFNVLSQTPRTLRAVTTTDSNQNFEAPQPLAAPAQPSNKPSASANWPTRCAFIWLAGVLAFSIRALGGWIVLTRLRRAGTLSFPAQLLEKCRVFEQCLGLRRRINYLQSRVIDTPSVAGWLWPVVLMPVSAISGLSNEQLEAVIVHELAHIKRLDGLVNLFQIAAETLLFYHPAVWWTNRVIRNERENCCDDISVQLCGNASEYARALTVLESVRATPSWALSATGGNLKARVMRLLRPPKAVDAIPSAGVAMIGIFCATAILAAAAAVAKPGWKPANSSLVPQPPHAAVAASSPLDSEAALHPADASEPAPVAPSSSSAAPANESRQSAPAASQDSPAEPTSSGTSDGSYIDGLKSAGLKDLTVEEIISLKIQGVTPEYIQAMRRDGFDPTIHDLIAMKVQGVSPEYVHELRATGLNPTMHELVDMKVQGIDPQYVRDMKTAGLNPSVHELVGMKVQGVTPEYAQAMKAIGSEPIGPHDLISMKVQGVDPEYVRAIRATGLSPNLRELISMKVQGVDPEYVRALKSAGLADLRVRDYISAKVQGVTPEFIARVRSHGFQNLTIHQLIELKNAGVF